MAESRTCKECGFLTIQGRELSRPERIMLGTHGRSAVMPAHPEQTRCFKNLWDYDLHYTGDTFDGVIEEIERSRDDCPGFIPYEAGFTPGQHLEIQLEQKKQKLEEWDLKWLSKKKSDLLAQLAETEKFPDAQEDKKEVSEEGNIFRREGDAWKVSFNGIMVPNVPHSIGMDYIKYLLENSYQLTSASAFIKTPPTSEEASPLIKMNKEQLEKLGLTKSTSLGDVRETVDDIAKHEFKNKIQDLVETINDKTLPESERLKAQEEKEQLIKYLSGSLNKNGKPRKSYNKGRTSVSNAITRAITHIRKHHSPLAEHLGKNIHLGYSCIYTPPVDPNWNT